MADERTFKGFEQQAKAAPYSDGILDLFMAALFVGIAAVWAAARGELLGLLAIPIIIGGTVGLRAVKRRITEPRIGFVEPRTPEPSSLLGTVAYIAGALAILIAAVAMTGELSVFESWRRWAPFLSGYLIAGAFWYLADSSGGMRYRILAAFSVILGFGISVLSDGGSYEPMAIFFSVLALAAGLMGGVTLLVFLRRHPREQGVVM